MSIKKNIIAIKINIINDNTFFDIDILCEKKKFKKQIKPRSIKSLVSEYAKKIYLQKSYMNFISYQELFEIYKILIDKYNKKTDFSFVDIEFIQSMKNYNYKMRYIKGMIVFRVLMNNTLSAAKKHSRHIKISKFKKTEKQKNFGVITPNRLINLRLPIVSQLINVIEKNLLPEYYYMYRGLIFVETDQKKWIVSNY